MANKIYSIDDLEVLSENPQGIKTYEIKHNLDYYPHVTLLDSERNVVDGAEINITDKVVKILSDPQATEVIVG